MNYAAFRAVLFDLDGVLIDTEDSYTQFWNIIHRKYVSNCPAFCEDIKGNTIEFILEKYIPANKRFEVREMFFEFEQEMSFCAYEGAVDAMKFFRKNGLKIAIVTSSDDVKMNSLKQQHPQFYDLSDIILTATDMKASKPAPDCWILAAKRLNVDIKDCIVIEDSINGLKSAKASSGYVIGVTTGLPQETVALYADVVISEIKQLL